MIFYLKFYIFILFLCQGKLLLCRTGILNVIERSSVKDSISWTILKTCVSILEKKTYTILTYTLVNLYITYRLQAVINVFSADSKNTWTVYFLSEILEK